MNKIKELRRGNNITQERLSDILSIGRSTLAMYEIGKSEPDNATLVKLADYFNVTVDYLLERSDVPNGVVETFSKTEKELIGLFRLLSPFEQEGIMIQIKALAKAHASV